MLKKIIKKNIYLLRLTCRVKISRKTLNFQRGPTAKFKPQFNINFVKSQAKELSLK